MGTHRRSGAEPAARQPTQAQPPCTPVRMCPGMRHTLCMRPVSRCAVAAEGFCTTSWNAEERRENGTHHAILVQRQCHGTAAKSKHFGELSSHTSASQSAMSASWEKTCATSSLVNLPEPRCKELQVPKSQYAFSVTTFEKKKSHRYPPSVRLSLALLLPIGSRARARGDVIGNHFDLGLGDAL